METDFDIVIAGGGLNGPTLALALAQAGLSVAVVDPRPAQARADAAFDGRAYALALASQRLLAALGLWRDLAGEAQEIRKVAACQGAPGDGPGPFGLHFDGAEIEEGRLGYMLEDRFLYRALLRAMQGCVTHLDGVSVVAQQPGPAAIAVDLSDGRRLSARLLVGADGRQSGVASRAGIRRLGHDYGQIALVAAVDHELPHQATAHQFFMSGGPLAILPLPGNRSSIVWSEPADTARAILDLPDADFLAVLRPRFGDFLGAIRLAGPRFSYPLSLSLAETYVAPRLALIGDAAHGVHPIAGQGLNLGLRDVAALAEVVVTARRRGEDPGAAAVLGRYQDWRRPDATALALGMDGVNALFSNANPLLRAGRELGMGLVNAVPALRRGFMRQAAGLSLRPMPRLLAGQRL
ncbi:MULTISPECIES: UbiH/UbiF/VisC/COQ6 family ubiquinone biosynthesis hydroxylase [unclassified Paracoccus (in: a-proteobacteria)]|uniref:UbiH/UbiF/VisC/COQ6 family ubiquinone biosynthesis hydroxylase n=1 Tax=unclassified Paracoccus (in: a-proteobacteria) TaxID=2688777 RepID=UPI0012B3BBFF|nr:MULTISPECIES: UbiH/UbiF/VisC/COQ6 family ubiquinone biosynthesis hydroxylase [unclassified Paracoccus (in: a-proteobacteria)]UXU75865.1 UbiH/UbiF/VisC/COQ6 family ubiquinone biosynthesis hydroxylase [Paracoccus sp. SMMA_5]UXU81775.1 UbiH/UbiF/VisC/COQ6 family ubiquinone biosynthesis hydroxylase [Paracoccus sp. SMMA_5_TC]